MLSNTQYLVIINTGKDLKKSKHKFNRQNGQVGSRTSEKKYIDRLDSGTISYQTPWTWDFTCPTFRMFEISGQVGYRACDMGPCKWIYRHL